MRWAVRTSRWSGSRADRSTHIAASVGLPVRERIGLLLQVCKAVAHAHSRLVIHRDLKPGNILVTADGQVRLLDFGIAKLMEGDQVQETGLTQRAGRALTLDYASPEQIAGAPLGTASDVYSLGVVAYELLSSQRPYRLKRGSAAELEESITGIDLPRASDSAAEPALKKRLRGDLDAILNKALKKSPADRYPTMTALADDFERHLQGFPVLARPESRAYRARRFLRRHRVPVAAGFAVVSAMGIGLGVALWQSQQAQLQARRAEAELVASGDISRFMQGVFARTAADPGFTAAEGRRVLTDAVRKEIALAAPQLQDKPKTLGELYANTGDLLARLEEARDALDFRLKSITQFERAGNTPMSIAAAQLEVARSHYRLDQHSQAQGELQSALARLAGDDSVSARLMRAGLWRQAARSHESVGRLRDAIAAAQTARQLLEPDLTLRPSTYADIRSDLLLYQHLVGDDVAPLEQVKELSRAARPQHFASRGRGRGTGDGPRLRAPPVAALRGSAATAAQGKAVATQAVRSRNTQRERLPAPRDACTVRPRRLSPGEDGARWRKR